MASVTADGADADASSAEPHAARVAIGRSVDPAVAASGRAVPAAIDEAIRDVQQVDERLTSLVISWEEWEVLYRVRLQVERDLRAAHDLVLSATDGTDGAVMPAADAASPSRRDGQPGVVARVAAGLRQVLDRLDLA